MNLNYNNPTPGVEPVDELPPTPAGTAAGLSPFGAGPAAHAAGAQSGDEANEEANGHGPARTRSDAELTALVKDSPFLDVDHPIDAREALKMVIMFPVVLLKWAALLAAVVYSWFVLLLLLAGQPKNQPMGGIRRTLVSLWIKAWASFVLVISGFYWIPVKGWQNVRDARASRAIVVFNHESYVDPLVLGALLPPSGIAKSGVAEIPFIGLFARALQFLFVERRGSRDAPNRFTLRSDPVEAIAARAADPRFPLVMVAPEATTKSRRCLLRFRRGAFAPGRPVVPVLLRYSYRHFNPGWGIEYSTPLHVWRLLSQPINFLSVEVLPVYRPSAEERDDPTLFAANVRQVMARRLGVPLVDRGIAEEHELLTRGVRPNLWGSKVVIPPKALGGS